MGQYRCRLEVGKVLYHVLGVDTHFKEPDPFRKKSDCFFLSVVESS